MITVKTYTEEVCGKLDGNSDWFTTDSSKAMPPGRGLYYSDYLALSLGNFTEQ